MKKEKRHWKKQLAINIVYFVGLVFLIKIPEFYKWKKKPEKVTLDNGFYIGDKHNRRQQNINEKLGEKRF